MLYEIRAADALSNIQVIRVSAANPDGARAMAVNRRLTPLSVRACTDEGSAWRSRFDLPLFAEELQMLLSAGLSLVEALDGLAERQQDGHARALMTDLAAALRRGDRLSTGMARHPESFPDLFVGIVKAAETTSSLPESLSKFVAYDAHLRSLREKLGSAAIYPAILLVAGSGVTLFLMVYVVPRFAAVYQSSGRPMPAVSQALLELGTWLGANAAWLAAGAAILIAAVWRQVRRSGDGQGWLQLLRWFPGAGERVQTIEVARFYRTLGMLLEGGLPVREALTLAASVVPGPRRPALAAVQRSVEGGRPLSASLCEVGLGTPLATRLIQVGERSGQLGAMLQRAAGFHEHETGVWIERFSKVVGPALMVLISLIVGVVVVFLYIPVFDLAGSLQ